jgi:perosamine synthetase
VAERLAIHGGTPVVGPGEVQPWPHVTDADRAAVARVLAEPDLTVARQREAEGLAAEFATYMGLPHAVPVNSGTAALHLAVAGIGLEPGDEVICPAFTYWATAAAVLHHNGVPVFVDVEPGTWTMDPALVEERITERTRALMPVHIHGMPADIDPLLTIADRHGLKVIEDCAQSHGARYKGRLCGAIGDAAGFSLQATKLLTTGSEGGLFVTGDDQIAERARLLQYLGEIVVPGRERQDQSYNAFGLGWMYRGDVFGQAFARSQLQRLDALNEARRANCELLRELLSGLPGVCVPELPPDRDMVWYTFTVRFEPSEVGLDVPHAALREAVSQALLAEGVPVGRWQTVPVPGQRIFQDKVGYGRGCPWSCPHAGEVSYDVSDYPITQSFIDSQLYVFGIWPPNDAALMGKFASAFEKVLGQPEALPISA